MIGTKEVTSYKKHIFHEHNIEYSLLGYKVEVLTSSPSGCPNIFCFYNFLRGPTNHSPVTISVAFSRRTLCEGRPVIL